VAKFKDFVMPVRNQSYMVTKPLSVLVTWFTTWFRIQKFFEYIFPVQCIYVI